MEPVAAALREKRFETARRLCGEALVEAPAASWSALRFLHAAQHHLGDLNEASAVLSRARPETDTEKLEMALLRAADAHATQGYDFYRLSPEGRSGLTYDEYLDGVRRRIDAGIEEARSLARNGDLQQFLKEQKMLVGCPGPIREKLGVAAPSKPAEGTGTKSTGSLCGRVKFPDGSPVTHSRITIGLAVSDRKDDVANYLSPNMHYVPGLGPQASLATETDIDGRYRFDAVPAGVHAFLSLTLDPDQNDLHMRFVARDIEVRAEAENRRDAVVEDWESAPAIPVTDPFDDTLERDGVSYRRVHTETFRNPFHFTFPRQPVRVPLPLGVAGDPDRMLLVSSREPDTPLPLQVCGTEVLFFTEMAPVSDHLIALYWSDGGTEGASEEDLSIAPDPDGESAVLDSGTIQVRIPWRNCDLGTAPILGVRRARGAWRGQGRLLQPNGVRVLNQQTRVLSQGTLELSVAVTYCLSNGSEYALRLTVHRDEDYVLVHEVSPELEGAAFEFSLAEFNAGRAFIHWTPETGSRHWYDIKREDREIARLQESVMWWSPTQGFACAMTPDGSADADYIGVFTVRRGEWIDRAFEKIAQGPGDANRELDWPFPEMVGSTISMITANTSADGDAFFRFGFFEGERKWGLLVSDLESNDGTWKQLSAVQHKLSSPRLQDFKDWTLDEKDRIERPYLVTRRDRLRGLRAKRDHPAFASTWKAMCEQESNGCAPSTAIALRAVMDGDPVMLWRLKRELVGVAHVRSRMTLLGRDYSDMYSPVGGRPIRPWAEIYDLIAATGCFTAEEERLVRSFLMLMGNMYLEEDHMNWRFGSRNANFEADRVDIVAAIGLAFHGNPDADRFIRHSAERMEQSLTAYCTPGSGKWYENPACYYLHAASCRLNLAWHLYDHDILDSSAIPRLKDFLRWGPLLLTPPIPSDKTLLRDGCDAEAWEKAEKTRRVPPIGDHADVGQRLGEVFASMGKTYRERDPAFADFLAWAYASTTSSTDRAGSQGLFMAAMEEADLKPRSAPEHLKSRRLEGFGAIFRGDFGTAREFYLLLKLGPGGYRYHRTEGSILLFADGKPLIYDGGEAGEAWRHTTLSFRESHAPLAPGHIERFHSLPSVDFAQGVHPKALGPGDAVYLSDSCEHTLVEEAHKRFSEPNPADIRSVLWVKGDYVVLHDDLYLPSELLTHWHLQAVSDEHDGDWQNGYRFKGRFGTDLQVSFSGQRFEQEEVKQTPIHEYRVPPGGSFSMRHLQLSATSPDQILAVLRPLGPGTAMVSSTPIRHADDVCGVNVEGDGIADHVFMKRQPVSISEAGVSFEGRYGGILRRNESTTYFLLEGTKLESGDVRIESNGVSCSLTQDGSEGRIVAEGNGTLSIRGARSLDLSLSPEQGRVELSWPV